MTSKITELTLGAATLDDVAALSRLEASYYPDDGYPAPLFYQALHQWPDLLQVARVESDPSSLLAGYCLGAPGQEPQELWLMSLLVDQTQRGMGLGKRLLQHWLLHVTQRGYRSIWLSVAPANEAAIKLYQACGFVIQSTEKDYLGIGEDRHVMRYDAPAKD